MVGWKFMERIAFVLLIASCILQSLCVEEKPTNTGETVVISSDVVFSSLGFETDEKGKTDVQVNSSRNSLDGKSVEQQDLGKTKEVNDISEKVEEKKYDAKVNEEDVKEDGNEKEDGKDEGEEEKSEKGIDLKVLNDNDFEHLTQASTGATTGDWLVLFTKDNNCDDCTNAEKVMKIVYERVRHKLNVAKVIQSRSSKRTFKRFDIKESLPIIFLFHHGKRFSYKHAVNVDEFIQFLEGGFELSSSSPVREPYTLFEYYTDETIEELKHMLFYKKNVCLVIFLTGFISGLSVMSLCGSIIFHLLENFKDEYHEVHEEVGSREQAKKKDD